MDFDTVNLHRPTQNLSLIHISERTGHLPGVAIAIMGCIVNGPGEMADADFGYVGGAPGKIDLYVGKEVVKRGIPNDGACDELIQLIKVGPGGFCSSTPRHRMPINSRNEGLKCGC